MAATQFPFTVESDQNQGHTINLTVRVEVGEDQPASAVLHYLRSRQVKEDLMNNWVKSEAPGYGMEIRGGPRPVFEVASDRSSPVEAYEQEFRLTRPI